MTNLALPQTKGITGLDLAIGVFTKCSDGLTSQLSVALTAGRRKRGPTEFRIGINGGLLAAIEVGTRKVDIAYVNPSAMARMVYTGQGLLQNENAAPCPRCFPSLNRIALAVSGDHGVRSLDDIARRKISLHVFTRFSGFSNVTYYTIVTIFSLYGFSFAQIKKWGGRYRSAAGRSRRTV